MIFYKYQPIWNPPVYSLMMLFFCYSSTMSSKATLAFLICGVIMHYSVICSPVGLSFPSVRYVHLHLTSTVTFEVDIASLKGEVCALLPRRVASLGCFCAYSSLLDYWITASGRQSISSFMNRNIYQPMDVM